MARTKSNGNGKLEDAMAALVQAQAILVQTQATQVAQKADLDKEILLLRKDIEAFKKSTDERFSRIEAILLEHNRILTSMPDLVREKIGFKAQQSPA